jgi:hypothetical protein
MPNWCMNSGHIYILKNASDESRAVFEKLKENNSEKGWFANIAPTPNELCLGTGSTQGTEEFMSLEWLRSNSKFKGDFGVFTVVRYDNGNSRTDFQASDEYLAYLKETYGASDWYSWNVENYGTKWDVNADLDNWDDGGLSFSFDSAWGAPVEFFEKYLKPLRIGFELRYYETGSAFAGYATFTPHDSDPKLDDYDSEYYEGEEYITYLLDEDMEEIEYLVPEVEDYDNYEDFSANTSYGEEVLRRVRNHYTPPAAPVKATRKAATKKSPTK